MKSKLTKKVEKNKVKVSDLRQENEIPHKWWKN